MAKAAHWLDTDAEVRKCGEQTGLDTLVVHTVNDECQSSGSILFGDTPNGLSIPPGEYGRKIKTQRIDGGPHKRWSMWFNSKQRAEPYQPLTYSSSLQRWSFHLVGRDTGAAWLSSARVVRCSVKSGNERNPHL